MDFEKKEDSDGIRVSYNCLPKTKLQHDRNIIEMGTLYTPLNIKSEIVTDEPENMIMCRQCRAFLNPYVGLSNDVWNCQFCGFSNRLSSNEYYPLALDPENSTIEYRTGKLCQIPPIFLYVVDTAFAGDDVEDMFRSLKESISESLALLPENCLVGLISFGKNVLIHDLTVEGIKSNYIFSGSKEYTMEEIQKSLGLLSADLRVHNLNEADPTSRFFGAIGSKFLKPVGLVEGQLNSIVEDLLANTFPHSSMRERLLRATGAALNVSSLLLKSMLGAEVSVGGHILCFISGPCTYGPGKIVNPPLKEPMRSHHDIIKSHQMHLPSLKLQSTTQADLSLYKDARKLYSKLSKTLVSLGLSCSFFIGCLDQVGLYEMDEMSHKTGGLVVYADSFSTSIFKQSFLRFFKKQSGENSEYLDMAFNSTLECKTVSDLKIKGLIGHATAIANNKSNPMIDKSISAISIGEGKTNSWKLCNVTPQSTYAIYFEKCDSAQQEYTFIQYLFHYQHASGDMRLRVTTIPIQISPDSDNASLNYGFDQEAASILLAREMISTMQFNDSDAKSDFDPSKMGKVLDDKLISICFRYCTYIKNQLESFVWSSSHMLIPEFIYHLRRSAFINVFNSSPDETSFLRHVFMHEDTANSFLMVQPALLAYNIDTFNESEEPKSTYLDSSSLDPNGILLLDTFFHILIYHGEKIAAWRKAGYHEMEEYEHFKRFLEAPRKEAMEILVDRFPLPRFIDCDEGGSQARFLMARLNPSTSYATASLHIFGKHADVLTDDISLQSYIDHIKRIIVAK